MWRARIGLIYPADGLIDDEFWKFTPKGVSVHITRVSVPTEKITVKMVTELSESKEIEEAARILKIIKPNVIAYACTSASFIRGVGKDLEIAERIEKVAGIPAITTSTAVVDALNALKIKKVAVYAPYIDEINLILKKFLEESGFDVVNINLSWGLQINYEWDFYSTSPWIVYELAKRVNTKDAEGIFIACTGFRTAEFLEPLEVDLGKPVVSANQATMWKALRMAGVRERISGYGVLFEKV